jgi:hypothetical protein
MNRVDPWVQTSHASDKLARRGAKLTTYSPSALTVVCQLRDGMLSRVREAFPHSIAVASSADILTMIARRNVDLVIADPSIDADQSTSALRRVRIENPSVLVAIYTQLLPGVVRHIVALASVGIDDVILRRTDDTVARFNELAARCVADPSAMEALHLLDDRLQRTTPALHAAIERLFRSPRRFRTTDDLAAAALTTRRGLYRQLDAAGFESPRLLIGGAKVLRAIPLLMTRTRRLEDVSLLLGYSKPELLSEQIRQMTGLRVRDIRSGRHIDEFPALVVARI